MKIKKTWVSLYARYKSNIHDRYFKDSSEKQGCLSVIATKLEGCKFITYKAQKYMGVFLRPLQVKHT